VLESSQKSALIAGRLSVCPREVWPQLARFASSRRAHYIKKEQGNQFISKRRWVVSTFFASPALAMVVDKDRGSSVSTRASSIFEKLYRLQAHKAWSTSP
jgi:hypothetical protein